MRAGYVFAWEDDPGVPHSSANAPVARPKPKLSHSSMAIKLNEQEPNRWHDRQYALRYWSAMDAIHRTISWVDDALPTPIGWNEHIGAELEVDLNAGIEFNAKYIRETRGIFFYRGTVGKQTIYSAESPDIVAHEVGHAVLDSLNPRLWQVADPQGAAFHEAFGDVSAMFSAIRIPEFCASVIYETEGDLKKSSRLSRMGEQLAWGVRVSRPSRVDQECLRNLANEFYYIDPMSLPPRAPASQLCAEEHSFSRVFSAAILDALAEIFSVHTVEDLQSAAKSLAKVLVTAAITTPLSTRYFADLAAHMLAADLAIYGQAHGSALRAAFGNRGILSRTEASELTPEVLADGSEEIGKVLKSKPIDKPELKTMSLSGGRYGLLGDFCVSVPSDLPRFVSASPPESHDEERPQRAAKFFVDSLFSQGKVNVSKDLLTDATAAYRHVETSTHEITDANGREYELRRIEFECPGST
ncbi:hypothetical protein OHA09_21065 [Streptomyces longwoodensis]|uniref:hypothetical protein n=1 Tax=Streptomyces longwoodensis TaxID=68231 RepID=UPI002E80C7CD|nr:hypothetical protein [Streptomyces longwoodensis]WUC59401.1 hypothetical protein OHA09_21065 [Streptomyces longwoodensis]